MTPEDEAEIVKLLRESVDRARGYADFFLWAVDRDLEEWGVVTALAESLELEGSSFFSRIVSRRRPNDPPDCEACDANGARLAIEVTELVDGQAIHKFKKAKDRNLPANWAEWTRNKFLSQLGARIEAKDKRFPELKEPPYPGGYVVVVHTDEFELNRTAVAAHLNGHRFPIPLHIERAFLLLSYEPSIKHCPFFELQLDG